VTVSTDSSADRRRGAAASEHTAGHGLGVFGLGRARRGRRRPAHVHAPGEGRLAGYAYVAPLALIYAGFVLVPLARGIWLSFFDWDGVSPATWAGLANYQAILDDPGLRAGFVHAFLLIVFYSLVPVGIGLVLAAVLSRAGVRALSGFRILLFLPQVMPAVAIGVMWRWVYAPDGALNSGLDAVGLGSLKRGWLGDFTLALPAVGLIGTWVTFGLCMVLFLAGVQKIPTSLYDAARIDGAGPVREFFAVTLPGLRNEIVVALVLTVIGALRSFDLIYITTQGGPGNSTAVPAFQIYRTAFFVGEIGAAAALGVALAVLILVVAFVLMRLESKEPA
jgi:raffinose/stachyose/melibiose transport system permease protein